MQRCFTALQVVESAAEPPLPNGKARPSSFWAFTSALATISFLDDSAIAVVRRMVQRGSAIPVHGRGRGEGMGLTRNPTEPVPEN